MCICTTESLCGTPETNTTLLINYIPNFKNFQVFRGRHCLLLGFPGGSVGKDLPAVQVTQEMQVRSLGQEDPHGNPLQYSCLENLMDRGGWQAAVYGATESDMTGVTEHTALSLNTFCFAVYYSATFCWVNELEKRLKDRNFRNGTQDECVLKDERSWEVQNALGHIWWVFRSIRKHPKAIIHQCHLRNSSEPSSLLRRYSETCLV